MIYSEDVSVTLVQVMGDDRSVIASARVSTKGVDSVSDLESAATAGLIRYLMQNRHGTPFEHATMTFFIKAPIFVFREFHRHRIGWSYNEESARYKPLEGEFYLPPPHRPGLMQVEGGRPGQYEYKDATPEQHGFLSDELMDLYSAAYGSYQMLLARGYAKEVARMVLPVGIFSSMYATCNPRSLMAFLSLRTKREAWSSLPDTREDWNEGKAKFPSKPQWEINRVADLMEAEFAQHFPITHNAFNTYGRVAP